MQKECATIAIIESGETRNLGIAIMKNYMPVDYVKIAISTSITK